ncbi:MAG: ABC transporter ATP-binding protein [Eubacteriales bacterium]
MSGIEIKNTSKDFGNVHALKNVSVHFGEKKIYGLLGRNGAGKSTLLNVITGRIFANNGEVLVDGETALENDGALQKIYMMSEKNYYPENMKIRDVFAWTREFYPDFDTAYATKLADRFELNINKKVKTLSTGYSSIFKLITALSTNAPYILLDEPVLGLDANHRDLFYRIVIEKFSENPCTVIISTHLIEEAAGVIDHVVIIKDGEIIKDESRDDLMSKGYTATGAASVVDSFTADKNVLGTDSLGGLKTAYISGTLDRSTVPAGIEISKMDLQRLFIQLTNS